MTSYIVEKEILQQDATKTTITCPSNIKAMTYKKETLTGCEGEIIL
jgi:hypothetical protein